MSVQGTIGVAAQRLVKRIEAMEALDGVADMLTAWVQRTTRPDEVKSLLSGAFLGHALHPMLTDLPIGFWTSAVTLDVLGGDGDSVDLLLGAGNLAALGAAATGLSDWSDSYGGPKRTGLVHAALNVSALSVFSAALLANRAGARRTGRSLSLLGAAVATASAYLGADLVYHRGLGADRAGFEVDTAVTEWTDAAAEADLHDGAPHRVTVNDVPIMLVSEQGSIHALVATCNHAGGPLDEGELAGGAVTCPWHGSRFRLEDGCVLRGPAAQPQPVLQTRVNAGRVEVRFA